MFVHSVFFWLNAPTDLALSKAFEAGLQGLLQIPGIRQGHVGKPATTRDAVIDASYTFALTLVFDDLAGHDSYQIHPLHVAFVERFSNNFLKVQVYDAQ